MFLTGDMRKNVSKHKWCLSGSDIKSKLKTDVLIKIIFMSSLVNNDR
jgi:hypothetical protein